MGSHLRPLTTRGRSRAAQPRGRRARRHPEARGQRAPVDGRAAALHRRRTARRHVRALRAAPAAGNLAHRRRGRPLPCRGAGRQPPSAVAGPWPGAPRQRHRPAARAALPDRPRRHRQHDEQPEQRSRTGGPGAARAVCLPSADRAGPTGKCRTSDGRRTDMAQTRAGSVRRDVVAVATPSAGRSWSTRRDRRPSGRRRPGDASQGPPTAARRSRLPAQVRLQPDDHPAPGAVPQLGRSRSARAGVDNRPPAGGPALVTVRDKPGKARCG